MKQLTKEQAIKFAKSEVWKEWTDHQIVEFQLFQNKLCMDFSVFHKAIEKVLGRPVFMHELLFRSNKKNIEKEFLGEKEKPTFKDITNLIPEEKRLIILED